MELKNVFLSKLFRIMITFFLMRQLIASLVDMYEPQSSKVDIFFECIAHTFFSPGKLIKTSELVLACVY